MFGKSTETIYTPRMNRDFIQQTSVACIECGALGYHTFGAGCAYCDLPRPVGQGELARAIQAIDEFFRNNPLPKPKVRKHEDK